MPALDLAPLRRWWDAHDGLDGAIRTLGAAAVVVTIEVLAGYFLWRGVTEKVGIPRELGWALQVGLTGGSVVGTRAFHRGQDEDKWWGLAASLSAVIFVVADASITALLLAGVISWNVGVLAVGVLVQCLLVGYLTVHTLMARPRAKTAGTPERWGGPETVTSPASVTAPIPAQAPTPAPPPVTPLRPVTTTARPRRTGSGDGRNRDELVAAGRRLSPPVCRTRAETVKEFGDRVRAAERAAREQAVPA